jgi:hypothetical protein
MSGSGEKTTIIELNLRELERLQEAVNGRLFKEVNKGRWGGLSTHNPWRKLSAKLETEIAVLKEN